MMEKPGADGAGRDDARTQVRRRDRSKGEEWVRAFIERRSGSSGAAPPLAFLDYDWSLNQAPAR